MIQTYPMLSQATKMEILPSLSNRMCQSLVKKLMENWQH